MAPRRGRSGLGIQDTGQEDPPSPRDSNLPPFPEEDPDPEQLEEHGEDLPAVDGGRAVDDPAQEDQIRAEEEACAREELVAQARAQEEQRIRSIRGKETLPSTTSEVDTCEEGDLKFTQEELARFFKFQEQQAARQCAAADEEARQRETHRQAEAQWATYHEGGPSTTHVPGLP
jgi:hypothetical protein